MKYSLRALVCGTALFAVGYTTQAQAQLADQTRTASPGRVEEQIGVTGVFQPRIMPRVEVKDLVMQSAPAGAERITFKLDRLNIEGASVYREREIESVFAESIGQTITLADLYTIAADLTRKYRNDGYVLTQVVVPPQTIEAGSARLQVVEGFIDKVEVRGEGGYVDDAVALARGYGALVRSDSQALNVRQLERTLLLINDLPGVSARGIIGPSATTPGAADLLIIVERKRSDASISVDNYGSRYLGPLQISLAGSINSLMGFNDRVTGQIAYAPDEDLNDELFYMALGYKMPVGTYGTSIDVGTSMTQTEPGFRLSEFEVEGDSRFFYAGVSHPFVRSRNFNVTGRAFLDYRDVKTENNFETRRLDKIRAARVGGKVEFVDTLMGVAYNAFDIEASHGLDILDATDDNPNTSRPAADSDFFKIELEMQRLQRIVDRVNLLIAVKGQMAGEALLSSEEFGVGGVGYGRGYDPSEIIGDEGVAGKLELQWNEPYEFAGLENYQLFGFWDGGRIWNKDATARNLKQDTVSSAGLGIRVDFTTMTQGGFFVAFPLNRAVETMGDEDPRVFFNVSQKF